MSRFHGRKHQDIAFHNDDLEQAPSVEQADPVTWIFKEEMPARDPARVIFRRSGRKLIIPSKPQKMILTPVPSGRPCLFGWSQNFFFF